MSQVFTNESQNFGAYNRQPKNLNPLLPISLLLILQNYQKLPTHVNPLIFPVFLYLFGYREPV